MNELGARRVAVAYFDIPNGLVCYLDLEKKPMNVLNGSFAGPADVEGSVPDLEHTGVPIPPTAPDLSTQATQILDFDPDAILYSAPVASCLSLVNALSGLGWDRNRPRPSSPAPASSSARSRSWATRPTACTS